MCKYGVCEVCGVDLEPIHFLETEYKTHDGLRIPTGRTRVAVSHLTCPVCLRNYCVDDTFDERWK